MKLKKLLATILTTLAICTMTINTAIPPLITEAHSGRTDSRGGHKDNKNKSGLGYYHYHCGGNPPHLHKDGVCPYAKTSNSNSSPSNIKDSTSGTNNNNTTDNNTTSQSLSTVYNNVAFNAQYYASNYPDVYMIYGNNAKALYEHFISSGITEGRQSSEQFSIFVYKENNQDLVDVFGDDLISYYNHFIEFGVNENRISK